MLEGHHHHIETLIGDVLNDAMGPLYNQVHLLDTLHYNDYSVTRRGANVDMQYLHIRYNTSIIIRLYSITKHT